MNLLKKKRLDADLLDFYRNFGGTRQLNSGIKFKKKKLFPLLAS